MNTVKKAKLELKQQLEDLVSDRVNELLNSEKTEAFKLLKKSLEAFENNCDDDKRYSLHFDESGSLVSRLDLDLSDFSEEEFEVIEEVLNLAGDGVFYFGQDQYSQGKHQWYAEICLGEVVSFDPSPERNCYSIYSQELGLKIMRVTDEEHGLALIEQSMRKSGVYPSIVHMDRYGSLIKFWDLSEVLNLSDEQLQELISKKEEE